ncbi:class I SAM-dependent methyltransferase [Amycolatopsis sp. MtRt-6]|uniref:class I SAM-dependent methyltransferase n=1 Tax=Amycolatopsis sp. MtRt-6 TaxID=2792782 RepID=UPI0027DBCB02|nr:class I SAM-dependent methyltransferase [Amycolatopsis sp. MtRt-6]
MLADEALADAAVEVERVGTGTGYRLWSATYDRPNSAFDLDEPVVTEIVGALPAGVALDAACGTGRYAGLLAGRGHRVIGIDRSPEMLAWARTRVPRGAVPPVRGADGRPGRLASHRHPIGDYLRAAPAAGLQVRRCEEPAVDSLPLRNRQPRPDRGTCGRGAWPPWCPKRHEPSPRGAPALVVWHFQR